MIFRLFNTEFVMISRTLYEIGDEKMYSLDFDATQEECAVASICVSGGRRCAALGDLMAGYITTDDMRVMKAKVFKRTALLDTEWWCAHIVPHHLDKRVKGVLLKKGEITLNSILMLFVITGHIENIPRREAVYYDEEEVTLNCVEDAYVFYVVKA